MSDGALTFSGPENRWTGRGKGEKKLGNFIVLTRCRLKSGRLTPERIRLLNAAGFPWKSATRRASSKGIETALTEATSPPDVTGGECTCAAEGVEEGICALCAAKKHLEMILTFDDAKGLICFTNTCLRDEVNAMLRGEDFSVKRWYHDFCKSHPKQRWQRESATISVESKGPGEGRYPILFVCGHPDQRAGRSAWWADRRDSFQLDCLA